MKIPAINSVQSLRCVWLFAPPWTAGHQAFMSITKSQNLLKLMSVESVMPSNHLILCWLLLLLPSIFPSIGVFFNESVLRIRWPKYWSISFSISPASVYSGLISLMIDWFDPLTVQRTLNSLLQILPKMCIIAGCVNLPSVPNINILFSWSPKSHLYFPHDLRFTSHLTSISILWVCVYCVGGNLKKD